MLYLVNRGEEMAEDSATRVEVGLRGALLAKSALELLSVDPKLARLCLADVAEHLRDLDEFLRKKSL